jgi:hypothetical protein
VLFRELERLWPASGAMSMYQNDTLITPDPAHLPVDLLRPFPANQMTAESRA